MSSEAFGPIELMLFLGTPLLLSASALAHHLWTERKRPTPPQRPRDGGPDDLET